MGVGKHEKLQPAQDQKGKAGLTQTESRHFPRSASRCRSPSTLGTICCFPRLSAGAGREVGQPDWICTGVGYSKGLTCPFLSKHQFTTVLDVQHKLERVGFAYLQAHTPPPVRRVSKRAEMDTPLSLPLTASLLAGSLGLLGLPRAG